MVFFLSRVPLSEVRELMIDKLFLNGASGSRTVCDRFIEDSEIPSYCYISARAHERPVEVAVGPTFTERAETRGGGVWCPSESAH